MTKEELDRLASDEVCCPYCPWTRDDVNKPRIGMCEGNYCEQAKINYVNENDIDLE